MEHLFFKIHKWFMSVAAESAGYLIGLAVITGAINVIFSFIGKTILFKVGIKVFKQKAECWKWIGTKIIMSMSILGSDRCSFYQINNGHPYFDLVAWHSRKHNRGNFDYEKEINEFFKETYEIICNDTCKTNDRGIAPLPCDLDVKRFKELIYLTVDNGRSKQIFRSDLPENSKLRYSLLQYGIEGILLNNIESEDGTKLYGFVIHTFSDVRIMPKNVLVKHEEHFKDLRNSIRSDFEEILSLSFRSIFRKKMYKIWEFIKWQKN